MESFIFEAGTGTKSCRAMMAFLILVSISAIGSETVISTYQLDFFTPGICPARASRRKQIRHRPNLRM
jgi:hypothetical protein